MMNRITCRKNDTGALSPCIPRSKIGKHSGGRTNNNNYDFKGDE